MLEMIWKFPQGRAFDDAALLSPVLDMITRIPGFSPLRYDLNQHGNWRAFNRELTLVDALTQRSQLVRIEGQRNDQVVYIALGKHGEQPTVIAALREHGEQVEALEEFAEPLFEQTDATEFVVTSSRWRTSLESRGVVFGEHEAPFGVVHAWRYDLVPSSLASDHIEGLLDRSEELVVTEYDDFVCWRFSSNFFVRDDAQARAISAAHGA